MGGSSCVVRPFPLKPAVLTLRTVYSIRDISRMANSMDLELSAIAGVLNMWASLKRAKGKGKAACIITEKLK